MNMNNFLYNLKESRIFQFIVVSIIILNAITIGVNTYNLSQFLQKKAWTPPLHRRGRGYLLSKSILSHRTDRGHITASFAIYGGSGRLLSFFLHDLLMIHLHRLHNFLSLEISLREILLD